MVLGRRRQILNIVIDLNGPLQTGIDQQILEIALQTVSTHHTHSLPQRKSLVRGGASGLISRNGSHCQILLQHLLTDLLNYLLLHRLHLYRCRTQHSLSRTAFQLANRLWWQLFLLHLVLAQRKVRIFCFQLLSLRFCQDVAPVVLLIVPFECVDLLHQPLDLFLFRFLQLVYLTCVLFQNFVLQV